jgi:hypothetical protein
VSARFQRRRDESVRSSTPIAVTSSYPSLHHAADRSVRLVEPADPSTQHQPSTRCRPMQGDVGTMLR